MSWILYNLCVEDVAQLGSVLRGQIWETKNYNLRVFCIVPGDGNVNYVSTVYLGRIYSFLRPSNANYHKLFLFYNKEKCNPNSIAIRENCKPDW